MQTSTALQELLLNIQPVFNPGRYAFVTLPTGITLDSVRIIASIQEPEGLSVIIEEQQALALNLPIGFTAAWITLTLHSDLAAVGLTAAFSTALAQAGISCNVVAGFHHDHLFVPVDQAEQAMAVLQDLSKAAARAD